MTTSVPLRSDPARVSAQLSTALSVPFAGVVCAVVFAALTPAPGSRWQGAGVLAAGAVLVGAATYRRSGAVLAWLWSLVAVGAAVAVRLDPAGADRTLGVVAVSAVAAAAATGVTSWVSGRRPVAAAAQLSVAVAVVVVCLFARLAPGLWGRWASGTLPLPGVGSIQVGEFTRPVVVVAVAGAVDAAVRLAAVRAWVPRTSVTVTVGTLALGVYLALLVVVDSGPAALTLLALGVVGARYERPARRAVRRWFVPRAISAVLAVGAVCVVVGGVAWQVGAVDRWAARLELLTRPQLQVALAVEAARRGGLVGRGLGSSPLVERIPVAGSDMIAAVLAGELGCLMVAALVGVGVVGLATLARHLSRSRPTAASVGHLAVVVSVAVQLVVAVLGGLGIAPLTGISAPLLVVGGSSLLPVAVALGSAAGALPTAGRQGPPRVGVPRAAWAVTAALVAGCLVLVFTPASAMGRASADLRAPRGAIWDRSGQVYAAASDGRRRQYMRGVDEEVGWWSPGVAAGGVESMFARDLTCGTPAPWWDQVSVVLRPVPCRPADVVLTLDGGVQGAARGSLAARPGAVAVMDARTGEVLALTSSVPAAAQGPATRVRMWTPGSVLKPFVAYAALSEGVWPAHAPLGKLSVGGESLTNAGGATCPSSGVGDALAYSCNTVLGAAGVAVGQDRLDRDLGLFIGSGGEYDGGALSVPVMGLSAQLSDAQVARTSIGQESARVSVLGVSAMYAALTYAASGGEGAAPGPHILGAVCADGRQVRTGGGGTWGADLDGRTAGQVLAALGEVTDHGTLAGLGSRGAELGRVVAGKSGTAQVDGAQSPTGIVHWVVLVVDSRWVVTVMTTDSGDGARQVASDVLDTLPADLPAVSCAH